MVLSHVHWDHIQGLPFFEPAYIEGTQISMYALRVAADELRNVIGGITRHEFFPVPLAAVPADFEFNEVTPNQPQSIGGFEVVPFMLNHPFGACGYRVNCDGTSLAYVSDTAPFTDLLHKKHFLPGPEKPSQEDLASLAEMRDSLVKVITGTDTVIYDTHFLPEEYERFPHYGHSTPDQALELCANIGVRRLVLYHHAPSHTDDMMDEIEDTYRAKGAEAGLEVVVARENMMLLVGQGTDPGVGV
jgi:phosphoribosyl 1,2-cyclic phosphodiesterase